MEDLIGTRRLREATERLAHALTVVPSALEVARNNASAEVADCIFCIVNIDERDVPLCAVFTVGHVPLEDVGRHELLAKEMVFRLKRRPRHVLSFQSRYPASGQWGGAVRGKRFIRAFSCFSEKLNEAVSIFHAVLSEDMTLEEAKSAANISQNEYFFRAAEDFREPTYKR